MMVPTNSTPSPDLEADMVRLRASSIGPCVSLKDKDNLSDIFFVCGDDCSIIQSHRVVLRSWSDFFAKVIDSSLSIKGPYPVAPYIVLKEVCGKDLQDIFKFIYHGEIIVERSRLRSLLRAARFLEINRLPELLENAEELRDDINNYNETMKDLTIKNTEVKDLNSDAASKCSSTTIVRSDAASKSSGRTSNNSIETNKSSDDGNDVFEINTSSKFVVKPVNEENLTKTVEQKKESSSYGNENSYSCCNHQSSFRFGFAPRIVNPLEEKLKKNTGIFSNIIRTPKAIEPVEALKPEKSPPNVTGEIEEIDLSD